MSRRRDLRVEFWTDEQEHTLIEDGAARAGMSVSAWLRWLARRECPQTVPTLETGAARGDTEEG